MKTLMTVACKAAVKAVRLTLNDHEEDVAQGMCSMHAEHVPRPLMLVEHHVFPVCMQMIVWKGVNDEETISVCPTGLVNLRLAILDLLQDGGWTQRYSPTERRLALLAMDRFRKAISGGDDG